MLASDEQRRARELLQIWEERLRKKATNFSTSAAAAIKAQTEIDESAEKMRTIRDEQARLRVRLDAADHAADLIWEQQDALGKLFSGLEDALGLTPHDPLGSGSDGLTSRADRRLGALTAQLEELNMQVQDLSRETKEFQPSRCTEPFVAVAHVLNAHSSELDAIQVRVDAAEQKLRDFGGGAGGALLGCVAR